MRYLLTHAWFGLSDKALGKATTKRKQTTQTEMTASVLKQDPNT